MDLEHYFSKISKKFGLLNLFGRYDFNDDDLEAQIFDASIRIANKYIAKVRHPLFLFIPKIARWFNIGFSDLNREEANQIKRITEWLDKRSKSNEPFKDCVLDRLFLHNEECKRNGDTAKIASINDIFGTCNIIAITSFDTS